MMKSKIVITMIFWSSLVFSQDLHYTLFEQSPLLVNPALGGLFGGDMKINGHFRDQWFSVPVPYFTTSASVETVLFPDRLETGILSVAGNFYYDQAGDTRLSSMIIQGQLSYHQQIAKNLFLGAGISGGYNQRAFRKDLMTFDDQFVGDVFNPAVVSADQSNITQSFLGFIDLNAGINLRYQLSPRKWVNIGYSIFHLTSPKQSFMGLDERLKMRQNIITNAQFQLHEKWDLLASVLYQMQGNYRELLFGTQMKYHLNLNPGRETAIQSGIKYRWADAISPVLGIQYQGWQFLMSYDINISPFRAATQMNGAFECTIIYIYSKVRPLPETYKCPIF